MNSYLLPEEELKRIHQQASKYRCPPEERVRLFCIYWAGMGKKVDWIHDMLFLPERTIYNYLQEYAAQKKTKNDDTPSSGRPTKLSLKQEEELKAHLIQNTYASTLAVIEYIHQTYGVTFSQGGLAKWMHRHGFRYKRPKRVPYTVDVAKQEEFVNLYKDMKKQAKDDEMILFIDGVHPDHQTQHVHGWIALNWHKSPGLVDNKDYIIWGLSVFKMTELSINSKNTKLSTVTLSKIFSRS